MRDVAWHCCKVDLDPRPFPRAALDRSIGGRFAEIVEQHAGCVAVRDRGRTLTYAELDQCANGIAADLLRHTEPGRPVILLQRQGWASIAASLGALKAGTPYAPLDPDDPAARLRTFADELGAAVVVTDRATEQVAAGLARVTVLADELVAPHPPDVHVSPDDVAYIFFTSGSTGRPKGVFDSHRNVLHNVLRYTDTLRLGPSDRLTILQAPHVSGAVSSMYGALLNGGCSLPFQLREDGFVALAEMLDRESATVFHSVPSIFRSLLGAVPRRFESVRVIRLEGDRASALDVELYRRWFGSGCVLVNGLGTTETGLVRQLFVGHDGDVPDGILPVGYPVPDVDVVVLGEDGRTLQAGETGEIGVQGRYLALGYWKNPELTARAFRVEPDGVGRRYLTGDVGRLSADGCLEYLGRRDGRRKVLGQQVETAEVEAELLRVPGIRDALVVTESGARDEGQLHAYVVWEDGAARIDPRPMLEERLPAASIPTRIVALDTLPLSANGKLDRAALAALEADRLSQERPVSDLEATVVELWSEILGVAIGPDDNVFELGADSLNAAEFVAAVYRRVGFTLPLSALVRAPTAAKVAALVDRGSANGRSTLVPLADGDGSTVLFLHGHEGHCLAYRDLVARLPDLRIIGLEHHGSASRPLEQIAADHVQALAEAELATPLIVAGHCYGGAIALELARLLARRGEPVALLVLMGVTPYDFPTLVEPDALRRWRRGPGSAWALVRRDLRGASDLHGRERLRYIRDRNRAGLRHLAERLNLPWPRSASREFRRHFRTYAPEPFTGRAALLLPRGETAAYTADPENAWRGAATDVANVSVLAGADPAAMLVTPAVDELAAALRAILAAT